MFIKIGRPSSLKEISIADWNKSNSRSLLSIAVIDDKRFAYADLLRKHDFNIVELGDISDIKAVSEYSIVVCDIKGVGKKFKSAAEGGHVIKEIRNRYPDKYIIAFSGSTFDPTFKKYFDSCDVAVKKDADIEEWINALDGAIEVVGNPIKRWIRTRTILLEHEMELFEVLKLEQAYIKAIRKKNPKLIRAEADTVIFGKKELLDESAQALASFVTKLISSGIVNSVTGG